MAGTDATSGTTGTAGAAHPPSHNNPAPQSTAQVLRGAAVVSHGLLTAWDEQGAVQLVAVEMQQPQISITTHGWEAVGMSATAGLDFQQTVTTFLQFSFQSFTLHTDFFQQVFKCLTFVCK